jgi:hypothetical protein
VVDEHGDLAAQFGPINGGQAPKGAYQVIGQFRRRWNVLLFRVIMHVNSFAL